MVEPLLGFAILGLPLISEDFCSFLTEALYILEKNKKKRKSNSYPGKVAFKPVH